MPTRSTTLMAIKMEGTTVSFLVMVSSPLLIFPAVQTLQLWESTRMESRWEIILLRVAMASSIQTGTFKLPTILPRHQQHTNRTECLKLTMCNKASGSSPPIPTYVH